MLIDTHCHLDFSEFNLDRDDVLKRARDAGIEYIINIGSSLENSRASVALSEEYTSIFATVGIHPHDAKHFSEEDSSQIRELANNDRVVAIGEVGLDFYRNFSERAIQEEAFRKFIKLAEEKNLPLIIHSRAAQDDILRILKEERFASMRGVVHCFSGDEIFLKECLAMDFFVSFTCNITYRKAENLRNLVKLTPLSKLLLETDAPFLSPEGFRGKRNEPMQVKLLAETIAGIKQISFNEIAKVTTQNTKGLFGLDI